MEIQKELQPDTGCARNLLTSPLGSESTYRALRAGLPQTGLRQHRRTSRPSPSPQKFTVPAQLHLQAKAWDRLRSFWSGHKKNVHVCFLSYMKQRPMPLA